MFVALTVYCSVPQTVKKGIFIFYLEQTTKFLLVYIS